MTPEDVPAGPLLIDTDVATWLLTGVRQAERWRPLLRGHLLTLSFVNVGELLALPAAQKWGTTRTVEWREVIRRNFIVLPFDANITTQWAPLHVRYRGHLHRGGTNDLWVAASALSAQPPLPLATNNLNDFTKIAADYPLHLIHPDL
ncbi:PIN domain-containing protein [Jatrophihabitans sp.]|uniref:PIN domain-containing protein n=1 Tax=Jatrophihabitans sp. TaxID=1932789 RepID=UPI002B6242E8|nr:PIN domain-containing protein [Jatrophihabitans sp.]